MASSSGEPLRDVFACGMNAAMTPRMDGHGPNLLIPPRTAMRATRRWETVYHSRESAWAGPSDPVHARGTHNPPRLSGNA